MRLVIFFLLLLIWGQPALAANFFPKPTIVKIGAPQKKWEEAYQYGFNGQMKVNEWAGLGNHYTADHWEYSPPTGRRYNKDDWNHNPSVSPYATFDNSPIWKSDPKGDDPSTEVSKESNGTYKVTGGAADGDKNIYVGKKGGEVIGQSLTPNSFLGDNGKPVLGAVINPNDQSGANFLNNEIMGKSMGLTDYMANAGNGKQYDFKDRGIGGKPAEESKDQYRYRGMPVDGVNGLGGGDKQTFASGRDIGNVGAGYVAGSHGLPWAAARLGFDVYQNRKTPPLKWQSEGAPTQAAEKAGFNVGQSVFKVQYHEDVKRIQQFDAQRTYPWGAK
jgi:hypothetical protein